MDSQATGDALFKQPDRQNQGGEDSFYDTITTPEYDNAVNHGATVTQDPAETARQEEEWRAELEKVEQEIATLRSVLAAKIHRAGELKQNLGIGVIVELKEDVRHSLQNIKESDAYQKTNEKLAEISDTITGSEAYQKTNAAFKSFGLFASKKLGEVRNTTAFKSFEEKVGDAYTSVKTSRSYGNFSSRMTKVRGSKSENDFGDVVGQTDGATAAVAHEATSDTATTASVPLLPEEKVPL
ncbi:hypothetical protein NP493_52g01046 [Ridgeia piscesae]|uniref:Tumor protein D54 n=1 Tax=Ridgeia piscesae TaxID=27915 RepID=A0AAD9PBA8_RIDPI|nr:hypothetical protein NP493_52g01046 [Ridgeia piscesae]